MSHYIYPKPDLTKSIYEGEQWNAYMPGQDKVFKSAWVSRRANGELCSVVNTQIELEANAALCRVKLNWPNDRAKEHH